MGRAISHPTHHFVEQTNVQRNLLKSYGIVARYVESDIKKEVYTIVYLQVSLNSLINLHKKDLEV